MERDILFTPEIDSQVSKAVVVLFPDIRTADGVQQEALDLGIRSCVDFRSATERILANYHREGFQRFALVYPDTDRDRWSPLYPSPETFDGILDLPFSVRQWQREIFVAELPNTIQRMNFAPNAQVFVGGYHAEDCVVQMTAQLRIAGLETATPDLRLTDKLPNLLFAHRAREMFGNSDPETREDNYKIWQHQKAVVERLIQKAMQTDSEDATPG